MTDTERVTDKTLRAWLNAGAVDRGIGGGLTFVASTAGALKGQASWILRYRFGGANREKVLGRYPDVSLKDAREQARQNRARIQHVFARSVGDWTGQWAAVRDQRLMAPSQAEQSMRRGIHAQRSSQPRRHWAVLGQHLLQPTLDLLAVVGALCRIQGKPMGLTCIHGRQVVAVTH